MVDPQPCLCIAAGTCAVRKLDLLSARIWTSASKNWVLAGATYVKVLTSDTYVAPGDDMVWLQRAKAYTGDVEAGKMFCAHITPVLNVSAFPDGLKGATLLGGCANSCSQTSIFMLDSTLPETDHMRTPRM